MISSSALTPQLFQLHLVHGNDRSRDPYGVSPRRTSSDLALQTTAVTEEDQKRARHVHYTQRHFTFDAASKYTAHRTDNTPLAMI